MFRHASLNRSYALAWNERLQAWVPAPEGTRSRGKRSGAAIGVALAAVLASAAAQAGDGGAAPSGGKVTLGQASIEQAGATTTIRQSSGKAAIDWQSFSIGAKNRVDFVQPSSDAIALNRVVGQDPTRILGTLKANGQVFIVNPNGVLFAPGAQVDAAGVVASTRSLSNEDFAAGHYRFAGSGAGSVVNQGRIGAADGGYVVLIGAQVVNEGRIDAGLGDVRLAAADQVTLKLDNGSLAGFVVDKGTLDALAANKGLIRADGGRIWLTAEGADALAKSVVNNSGVLEARGVETHDGVIRLVGDATVGTLEVGGRVDVSSASGRGGSVVATAHDVHLPDGAAIDASGAQGGGSVAIGGGWQGGDASIANAATVAMAPGARIDVSARERGNGGTAVLWSQERTGFFGDIAARGGAAGGQGGKVETSGHAVLQALGRVDASALAGAGGQWLLDPYDVTIAASGDSGTAYATPYTPGSDSVILASSIVSSLNSGASVTITTGSSGASAGNITVAAPIAVTGAAAKTLTLAAANNIAVNAAIGSDSGRLNVVLTADADASGSGSVAFSQDGKVTTKGGNFYAGLVSGTSASTMGQDFTMSAGSSIDVGGGILDIRVAGQISLAASSLVNTSANYYGYYNNGQQYGNYGSINLRGASIVSSNTDAATPDVVTKNRSTLNAGTIGSVANPVKFSAGTSTGSVTLSVRNVSGDSHVSEVGKQAFGTVAFDIGTQANSTHELQVMGDAGGDGTSGTGHAHLETDAGGVLALTSGQIRTAGNSTVAATSISISSPQITFGDNAVDVGKATFSASGTSLLGAAAPNGVADVSGQYVSFNGPGIGSAGNPIELANSGDNPGMLSVYNSGGSTFLKVVDDRWRAVAMTLDKAAGTHSVLFAGGDHIDVLSNGSDVVVPTINGGSDGQTFGASTGIQVTRQNRSVTLSANSGDLRFDDHSVAGAGTFTAATTPSNSTGVIGALHAYDPLHPVAQFTVANFALNTYNDQPIGGGGFGLQLERSPNVSNNTLSLYVQRGDVTLHELTPNHFKTISIQTNGSSAAQTLALDLNGPDDVTLVDSGSGFTLNASNVNLSADNRNFSLYAYPRDVQIDSVAPGSGSYSVTASRLKLNGDVVTDGGSISLQGYNGLDLLSSVRIDSNSDRLGNSGSVALYGNPSISATGTGHALVIDASSSDGYGGSIQLQGNIDNRAGDWLGGVSLDARGADASYDNAVYLFNASYRIAGDFFAAGATYLYSGSVLIDTEQGNVGAAGNIGFAGASLYSYARSGLSSFDASTTHAGSNGGNVVLATRGTASNTLELAGIAVDTSGGAGGTAGNIVLPAVATTLASGPVTQTYTGGVIELNGDLTSNKGAISLTGDVRLATGVTLDSNANDTGASGTVTVAGAGVSAINPGAGLLIDTRSNTASGGAVSVSAATAAGGNFIDSLTIDTRQGSSGSAGTIALAGIATEGAQSYTGGAGTLGGSFSSNGGTIALADLASVTLAGPSVGFKTDRTGGSTDAGALQLGTHDLNGSMPLAIDLSADGGGAAANLALRGIGNTTPFASVDVIAGTLTLDGSVQSNGAITLEARGAAADLNLNAAVQGLGNGNIVLAAGRDFINGMAADTGILPGTGRYLVYSAHPTGSVEGMTGYQKHYDQAYGAGATPAYAGSGNWFLYGVAPVITVAGADASVVYGAADPTLGAPSAGSYSGFIDGDTVASLSGPQTLSIAAPGTLSGAGHRTVGSHAITLDAAGVADSLGYTYAAYGHVLTVTPKSITGSGLSASNKVYDGSASASLVGVASASALAGDVISVDRSAAVASFADKDAGTHKSVSVSGITLGGADAANYVLVPQGNLSADITPKALTISGSSVTAKAYDGTRAAAVNAGSLAGLVGSETLAVTGSGLFADKNAGSSKNVATSWQLADGSHGGLAGNYSLAGSTLQGDIAQKAISTIATGANKVYDGSTAASAMLSSAGVVVGDTVSFSGQAALVDKNAGTGRQLDVTGIVASGIDAANYSVAGTATTTIDVAQKAITVAASGVNKVYDGSTAATATLSSAGVIGGDAVGFSGTAAFADKNVGTAKAVTVSGLSASGADAGNYSLNASAATTASIGAKAISVTATGVDKVYDGTTAASALLASSGVVSGDAVSFSGTAALTNKNVGTGKAVNVSGIAAHGADAGNYSVAATAATTADVSARAITVDASAANKVYDGSTAASATLGSSGVIAGDVLSFAGQAAFADKNAGQAKTVTVSGITASGADAGNYSVASTATGTADIAAKAISVTATAANKVYDGSRAASATLASTGVVAGDALSFGGSAQFADKNVGRAKAVTVSGISASGADAGNYSVAGSAATTADIAAKAISVTATAADKVYDGSTAASATLASAGVVAGDALSFSGSAAFADRNAGSGKRVDVSGIAAHGADAGNYSVATSALATADITPKAITATATGIDKVYDGSSAATVALASAGVIAGDVLSFSGNAAFADRNAGAGKAVSVGSIVASGADAGNYTVGATAATQASITPKTISVSAAAADKAYDGTRAASATLTSAGLVTGDAVSFDGSAAFADKNAGQDKAVTVSGIGASGGDAGNYRLANSTAQARAAITPKAIEVDSSAANKVYDGTLAVETVSRSDDLIDGDAVSFSSRGVLADRNVGIGKNVRIEGLVLSGADAANYSATLVNPATADVTPRPLTLALQGDVVKFEDGNTIATLNPGHYAIGGVVTGDSLSVTRSTGRYDDVRVGSGKTVSVTVGGGDYAAGDGTSLGNYGLYSGDLSAAIGRIVQEMPRAYIGAVENNAAMSDRSPLGGIEGPNASFGRSGFAAASSDAGNAEAPSSTSPATRPQGTAKKADAAVVRNNTPESLGQRRTFSLADGGMRLPAGVTATTNPEGEQ